jgi:class 3 adenylate cyclase
MESSSRTLVCSVLFLDIAEYSKKAVADQLHLKQAFNQMLSKALDEVPQRDRIILDTGDGAAVTFMGDPEDALFAAMSVRDMARTIPPSAGAPPEPGTGLPVRLGVNLGPVRLVKDLNGRMNIIGDGINVAQRVMSFSRPGQLLVSRSFYEVVSCLSRDYLHLFQHEGSRTDKHVREHEVYSVGGAPAARRVAETASQILSPSGIANWFAGMGPFGLRRSALAAAPALFFALLGAGLILSTVFDGNRATAAVDGSSRQQPLPAQATPRITPPPPLRNLGAVARNAAPGSGDSAKPAPALKSILERRLAEKQLDTMAVTKAEPGRAATADADRPWQGDAGRLELAITPWGTVFVDGEERGASPPLRVLDIAPGAHTIVIHNGGFAPHVQRVVVKAGEATRIRHRFR